MDREVVYESHLEGVAFQSERVESSSPLRDEPHALEDSDESPPL